jgi:zeaxanthin epoxidase
MQWRCRVAVAALLLQPADSFSPGVLLAPQRYRPAAGVRAAAPPHMLWQQEQQQQQHDGTAAASAHSSSSSKGKPEVIVAGGGIGGLCTALVLLKLGYDVKVYEKTSSYRPFGGPIQIASNAAEAIRRIDEGVYEKVLKAATVIGTRTNGLKDGISDEWFATFDLDSPARKRGQVSSVVIDRPILQQILLEKVGGSVINGKEVVGCEQVGERVRVQLSTGETVEGDMLVGSDGIKSRVRDVFDPSRREPTWSGYTCVAGMAYCTPSDIKEVGYKVWVGSRKYFVSVDVGGGRIQWYAFMNIPPGSLSVAPENTLAWLKGDEYSEWAPDVQFLLDNSPADEVEQRDLYDRPPDLKWSQGRICLLGDAAHPMMPNLGQGGGMAIEDALVLSQEIAQLNQDAGNPQGTPRKNLPTALARYNQNRVLRAAAVQGLSRVSSAFLFQYQPPLDIDWKSFPPKIKNVGPRSLITRACQGFLQNVAFPLQFEFLFSFPGQIRPELFADAAPGDFTTPEAVETLKITREKADGPSEAGTAEKDLLAGQGGLKGWLAKYW